MFWWLSFINFLTWWSLAREAWVSTAINIYILAEDWSCSLLIIFGSQLLRIKVTCIGFHSWVASVETCASVWDKIERTFLAVKLFSGVSVDVWQRHIPGICIAKTALWPFIFSRCNYFRSFFGAMNWSFCGGNIPNCHSTTLLYTCEPIRNFLGFLLSFTLIGSSQEIPESFLGLSVSDLSEVPDTFVFNCSFVSETRSLVRSIHFLIQLL